MLFKIATYGKSASSPLSVAVPKNLPIWVARVCRPVGAGVEVGVVDVLLLLIVVVLVVTLLVVEVEDGAVPGIHCE